MREYDVITAGGGLAGACLAKALAERGMKVLVLEREAAFKDRIRGEQMHPWGVAELRALGLYDTLREACGHELPWAETFLGTRRMIRRDVPASTPQRAPEFAFYHPAMQETVSGAALRAGAELRRGARVSRVEPGAPARVDWVTRDGRRETAVARMVVGCDGRRSMLRRCSGFEPRQDPPGQLIAGVLFGRANGAPADTAQIVINPGLGRMVTLFPQGGARVRAYISYPASEGRRFQGAQDVARFVDESVRSGAAAGCYAGVQPIGPLATFDAADTWVAHPYANGVALVGDAAASNDPSWGEGLSLTARDVRVLRDCLLGARDWDEAGHAYAAEHDRYHGVIHAVTRWLHRMFLEQSAEAAALRSRALPLLERDRSRLPDHHVSGPDLPFGDGVRRRFFGEE